MIGNSEQGRDRRP